MPYSLTHGAQYLAPIERSNRGAVHLRVRAILKAQKSTSFPPSLAYDPDCGGTGWQRSRVELRRGTDLDVVCHCYRRCLDGLGRRAKPSPAIPMPSNASVAGSGTAVPMPSPVANVPAIGFEVTVCGPS